MNTFFKKLSSVVLAFLVITTHLPVFANETLNLKRNHQKIVLQEDEELLWQAVNDKIKQRMERIFEYLKLSKQREEFKNKANRTDLDKMITALLFLTAGIIKPNGQVGFIGHILTTIKSADVGLIQTELLQSSNEEIVKKINSLDIDTLFELSTLLEMEYFITEGTISKIKEALKTNTTTIEQMPNKIDFDISSYLEIDELDLLVKNIPQIENRNLKTWVEDVLRIILNRLDEINQETLNKNGFIVIKPLGVGISGNVYLCFDEEFEPVAVKVMPEKFAKNSIEREKAIWEQIKNINNENVVKYKNMFSDNGTTCIFMEYIEESETSGIYDPKNREQVIDVAKQIFKGLKALHGKNIAHRDISPANILMTKEGIIKLCDFGHSKDSNLTQSFAGRVEMAAPEVLKKRKKQASNYLLSDLFSLPEYYDGKKADIYSAGKVICSLLFGEKSEIQLTHETKDRFGNLIGQDFYNFFERCLDKNPETRATADEALELLNQIF